MEKDVEKLLNNLEERLNYFKDLGVDFFFSSPKAKETPKMTLSLRERILQCKRCPLSQQRTNVVPGEGDEEADLMFVGEGPGRDEDLQGRPFVGRAGQLLTKIISAMNFQREDVYITNIIKCRPPENRNPHKQEIELCKPFLLEQIEVIRPKIIVTLGKVASDLFVQNDLNMTRLRGSFYDYYGIQVMPTFHPSYLIRNERNQEIRKMVWEDMKKVMAFLDEK